MTRDRTHHQRRVVAYGDALLEADAALVSTVDALRLDETLFVRWAAEAIERALDAHAAPDVWPGAFLPAAWTLASK